MSQQAPLTPNFDEETKQTLRYDGLPPLSTGDRLTNHRVAFTNVKELWTKSFSGEIAANFSEILGPNRDASLRTVLVEDGQIVCISNPSTSKQCAETIGKVSRIVDLAGGSISPALTSYGSELGLVDIALDPNTGDGYIHDPVGTSTINPLLNGIEVHAADGLILATRDALSVTSSMLHSQSDHNWCMSC